MSVVVARKLEDRIVIGADSASTFDDLVVHLGSKLITHGPMIAGVAGLAENHSLFSLFLQSTPYHGNDEKGMIRLVMDFRQEYAEISETLDDMHVLMAYESRLWFLDGFSVNEIHDYHAIGSGSATALGALYVGASVKEAINAACYFNMGCAPPGEIYEMPFQRYLMTPTGQVDLYEVRDVFGPLSH